MAIETYKIDTCMGKLHNSSLSFLTEEEKKEFNTIGYTGKNSNGQKTTYSEYLNSLQKGEFKVEKTRFDNGDFCESFIIIRVTA